MQESLQLKERNSPYLETTMADLTTHSGFHHWKTDPLQSVPIRWIFALPYVFSKHLDDLGIGKSEP